MSHGEEFPLSLTIKAVDQATAPLRAISAQFKAVGASLGHLSHASGLAGLAESFKGIGEGAHHVFENVKELGMQFLEMEAVGGFALFELVKGSVEAGSKLSEMAQRVGLGVDAYAQLQFAAGQAHVSAEEFNGAMDKFNKSLGQAKAGGGPLLEFLDKVSPKLALQVKHAKNTQEGLDLMAGAFEKVTDPGKRAALAAATFGKGSLQMGQFLGQGSAAIKELMKRHLELAGSQEKFAKNSEEAEKALNETGAAFEGLRNAAATELMPALTELAHTIADLVAGNRENIRAWAEGAGKAISAWVAQDGIGKLVDGFKEFAHTVGVVVDAVGGWQNVAIAAGAVMAGPLIMSVVQLGGAVVGILPGLASMAMTIGGPVVTAVMGFTEALGAGFTAVEALQFAFAPAVLAAAPFVLAAAGIAAAAYEIEKNWEPLKELFGDIWHNVEQATLALMGGQAKFRHIFGGGDDDAPSAFRGLPASSMRYAPGNPTSGGGDSKVTVDFVNMPKGVRAHVDPASDAPVDLGLGYAMGN